MDELWQEFCNGIANALGGLVVRSLFTKAGLEVAAYILGCGIVVVPPILYYWDVSPPESQARSIVKDQCRNSWSFYYKNRRMSSTGINLGHNSIYNFGIVPTRYGNISIIAAQSIKSDFSNFVGLAFGLPDIMVMCVQSAKAIAILIEIYHLYQQTVDLVVLMDIVRWKELSRNI